MVYARNVFEAVRRVIINKNSNVIVVYKDSTIILSKEDLLQKSQINITQIVKKFCKDVMKDADNAQVQTNSNFNLA